MQISRMNYPLQVGLPHSGFIYSLLTTYIPKWVRSIMLTTRITLGTSIYSNLTPPTVVTCLTWRTCLLLISSSIWTLRYYLSTLQLNRVGLGTRTAHLRFDSSANFLLSISLISLSNDKIGFLPLLAFNFCGLAYPRVDGIARLTEKVGTIMGAYLLPPIYPLNIPRIHIHGPTILTQVSVPLGASYGHLWMV